MTQSLPDSAQIVVIGGGVAGCSVAYHLTKLGFSEVVLLERKQLTSGTTWHAAGLVTQLRNSVNLTRMAKYSGDLYDQLEEETGLATGFKRTGSVVIALGEERLHELKRLASFAKYTDTQVDVLTPKDIKTIVPSFNVEDSVGGVYIPGDGQVDPANVAIAMAKGARNRGAQIFENIKITDVLTHDGNVTGVVTDQGTIKTTIVVNCAGMWARDVGKMAGVSVPLMSCEHYYIVSSSIPNLQENMPSVRVPEECGYYKEDAGKVLFGLFEHKAKPWGFDGIPEDFCFDQLPEDYDHFMPYMELALNRMPALNEVGIETFFNGPESFTPDDNMLIGEAPELNNFFVLAGFNSIGIQSAGGAGKYIAEWIKAGHPPCDLWEVDIRRMYSFQSNKKYVVERASETLGLLYADHFPYRQKITSRHVRKSPIHDLLVKNGACMGEASGWERANWFAPMQDGKPLEPPEYQYSWWRQNWFAYSAAEHKALREGVGVYDMTSFGKILVTGADAAEYLQFICANNVDVAVGRIVYTQFLNERACIEADVTVTRLSANRFLIVTGVANVVRDISWLNRNKPAGCVFDIIDITSAESCLCLMGPKSESMLTELTGMDVSLESFPFATSKQLEIGMANVRAHRISYVGECGWELYIPTEFTQHVAEELLTVGTTFDMKLVGLHAMDSCRTEKGFRHFGHDLTDDDNIYEAGLGFAVNLSKPTTKFGDFIGKVQAEKIKSVGLNRRLLQFKLKDAEPLLYHNEIIYKDGEIVGYLSSGNYGHTLGAAVGMGYVSCRSDESIDDICQSSFQIEVANELFDADVSLTSFLL